MHAASDVTPGKDFFSDLRLIRERKGIGPQDVFRAIKLPLEFVKMFEETGLLRHPHYNLVYLRSFVKEYARVIGVDENLAVEALEAGWNNRYKGSLAIAYLGLAKPEENAFEEEIAGLDDSAYEGEAFQPVSMIFEPVDLDPGPEPEGPERSVSDIIRLALSLPDIPVPIKKYAPWAVVTVVGAAILYFGITIARQDRRADLSSDLEVVEVDSTEAEITVPVPLLQDTMVVEIVARTGVLEPIRVSIDGSGETKYWVEEGTTLTLRATHSIVLAAYLDRLELVVDGHELPTSRLNDRNELEYSRESILEYLRGRQASPPR